jgi:hypothetical protein
VHGLLSHPPHRASVAPRSGPSPPEPG